MVMLNRDLGLKRFRINRFLNENAISRKKRGWGRKMVTVYVYVGGMGEGKGRLHYTIPFPFPPPQKKIYILVHKDVFSNIHSIFLSHYMCLYATHFSYHHPTPTLQLERHPLPISSLGPPPSEPLRKECAHLK